MEINSEDITISHAFTLLIQIFDTLEWNVPIFVSQAVEQIYRELFPSDDPTLHIWLKLPKIFHYITIQESAGDIRWVLPILTKVQSILQKMKDDELDLQALLLTNVIFVEAILSKKIQ